MLKKGLKLADACGFLGSTHKKNNNRNIEFGKSPNSSVLVSYCVFLEDNSFKLWFSTVLSPSTFHAHSLFIIILVIMVVCKMLNNISFLHL